MEAFASPVCGRPQVFHDEAAAAIAAIELVVRSGKDRPIRQTMCLSRENSTASPRFSHD